MNDPAEHNRPTAREGRVRVNGVDLHVREIGDRPAIIVLHGGPDFDHTYLLPELDQLADSVRLIYYDQRGRGRSVAGVRPEDVSVESEVADLDQLRQHFGLKSVALLGHSWGCVLALEYAGRHPDIVSNLILMNTGPASSTEFRELREEIAADRADGEVERMREIAGSSRYAAGDLEAEIDYYRIHFRAAVVVPGRVEPIVQRLRTHFTPGGVLIARAIEQRLYEQTWLSAGYDIVPRLREVAGRTLVLHGEHDLIPVRMAARIAEGLRDAELRVLEACGHFVYLEQPEATRDAVRELMAI